MAFERAEIKMKVKFTAAAESVKSERVPGNERRQQSGNGRKMRVRDSKYSSWTTVYREGA